MTVFHLLLITSERPPGRGRLRSFEEREEYMEEQRRRDEEWGKR